MDHSGRSTGHSSNNSHNSNGNNNNNGDASSSNNSNNNNNNGYANRNVAQPQQGQQQPGQHQGLPMMGHSQHQQHSQQQHSQQQQRYTNGAPQPPPSPNAASQASYGAGTPMAAAPKTPQQQQQRLMQMQQMQQQRQMQLKQIQRQQTQFQQQQVQQQQQQQQQQVQQAHQQAVRQNRPSPYQQTPAPAPLSASASSSSSSPLSTTATHQRTKSSSQLQSIQGAHSQSQSHSNSNSNSSAQSHSLAHSQSQSHSQSHFLAQSHSHSQSHSLAHSPLKRPSSVLAQQQQQQQQSNLSYASGESNSNNNVHHSSSSNYNHNNSVAQVQNSHMGASAMPSLASNSATHVATNKAAALNMSTGPSSSNRTSMPPMAPIQANTTASSAALSASSTMVTTFSPRPALPTTPKAQSTVSRLSSASTTITAAAAATGMERSNKDTVQLLQHCDWVDRTLWITRQMLGGQAVNGFLRSTATVQRIKKQRARQVAHPTKAGARSAVPGGDDASSATSASIATVTPAAVAASSASKRRGESLEQGTEEVLKHTVMNARTAKKIKTELEAGLEFCAVVHAVACGILRDMDEGFAVPAPLGPELPGTILSARSMSQVMSPGFSTSSASATAMNMPIAAASKKTASAVVPPASLQRIASNGSRETAATTTTSSTGAANGSTLRKHRKKKLLPSNEAAINLSEFDNAGKRIFTKKEHTYRMFEVIRYRALQRGDFVAARVSSRDLWILARVTKEYLGAPYMNPVEFLQLSEARRDQLFREKACIKDVEDKTELAETQVNRSLVLPLPRSFSEAAEWGQRYKKGSRVYAMYPHTTSLYTATVLDNTMYCRDDDDIIVVEFDGDDTDPTGAIPKCHIPARFVTLIPREFPGAQTTGASATAGSKSKQRRESNGSIGASGGGANTKPVSLLDNNSDPLDSMLMFDGPLEGLEGFDELDFDLLGGP